MSKLEETLGEKLGEDLGENLAPGGYAAGDAGADALAADIVSYLDGDAAVTSWDGWLVHDSDTYRTLGSGTEIATLISLNSGVNMAEATASQRPDMDAGNGPGGRDEADLAGAAEQTMSSGDFTTATGDRWGIIIVGKHLATGGTSQRLCEFNGPAGSVDLFMVIDQNGGKLRCLVHYDDGGSGTNSTMNTVDEDTDYHVTELYFSSPHKAFVDGTEYAGVETAGASSRADAGGSNFVMSDDIGAGSADVSIAFMAVVKLSGTGVPNSRGQILAALQSYYGL